MLPESTVKRLLREIADIDRDVALAGERRSAIRALLKLEGAGEENGQHVRSAKKANKTAPEKKRRPTAPIEMPGVHPMERIQSDFSQLIYSILNRYLSPLSAIDIFAKLEEAEFKGFHGDKSPKVVMNRIHDVLWRFQKYGWVDHVGNHKRDGKKAIKRFVMKSWCRYDKWKPKG